MDVAIGKLANGGEHYLETPMLGIVAVTKKGEDALNTGIYHFEQKSAVRPSQMYKAYPKDQVRALILYVTASSLKT